MTIPLLLGTYTRATSQGLYMIDFDQQSTTLANLQLIDNIGSPTYVTTGYAGKVIFTIVNEGDQGGVGTLVKQADGSYQRQNTLLEDGPAPCYVAFDQERELLYEANYHTGALSIYQTTADGQLTLTDRIQHAGSSVHQNQDGPHAHYFDLDVAGKFALSCDLGTDEVGTYRISETGKAEEISTLSVKPGTGPRHLTFHPNGEYVYIFGELSSEILVGTYDQVSGEIELIQTLSTLPGDFNGESSGAAIRISNDGQFLYASNRGHDSIVVYHIQEDFTLKVIQWAETHGQNPRDFNFTPDEQFIICGHQHTDTLSLFQRDVSSGKLSLLSTDTIAPEVVCVTPL